MEFTRLTDASGCDLFPCVVQMDAAEFSGKMASRSRSAFVAIMQACGREGNVVESVPPGPGRSVHRFLNQVKPQLERAIKIRKLLIQLRRNGPITPELHKAISLMEQSLKESDLQANKHGQEQLLHWLESIIDGLCDNNSDVSSEEIRDDAIESERKNFLDQIRKALANKRQLAAIRKIYLKRSDEVACAFRTAYSQKFRNNIISRIVRRSWRVLCLSRNFPICLRYGVVVTAFQGLIQSAPFFRSQPVHLASEGSVLLLRPEQVKRQLFILLPGMNSANALLKKEAATC